MEAAGLKAEVKKSAHIQPVDDISSFSSNNPIETAKETRDFSGSRGETSSTGQVEHLNWVKLSSFPPAVNETLRVRDDCCDDCEGTESIIDRFSTKCQRWEFSLTKFLLEP